LDKDRAMTATNSERRDFRTAIRAGLTMTGAVMLLVGLLILIWPGRTAMFLAAMVAAYLIVQGLIYLAAGVFSRTERGWSRAGHAVLGLLYVAAGVLAFVNLFAFTATLVLVTGILLGISFIVDGIVSLSLLGRGRSRIWTLAYAALSVVAGALLLLSPFYVAVFWLLTGAALVALGVTQFARALSLRRDGATDAAVAPPVEQPY